MPSKLKLYLFYFLNNIYESNNSKVEARYTEKFKGHIVP